AYVERQGDKWLILSAKYGLVSPTRVLNPYEATLNGMSPAKRRAWASRILADLRPRCHPGDRVVILAGKAYREHLVPTLKAWGCKVEVPMRGLGIGRQLQWLRRRTRRSRTANRA